MNLNLGATLQKFKLPLILLAVLLIPLFIGEYVPEAVKASFYALSLTLKSILIAVLPFIIFSFVFSCLLSLQSGVVSFILLLISSVFISNSLAIFTGYQVGSWFLPQFESLVTTKSDDIIALKAAWDITAPSLVRNETALICSFILGFIFSIYRVAFIDVAAKKINYLATAFLKKIFIPILPIFILGFVLKLEHDAILAQAFNVYSPVLLVVLSTQITYVLMLYWVAAGFSVKKALFYLKNVLPATLTGFSTVSSAASMPVLILQSEKNIADKNLVKTIIPAVINIHTLGSAIGLTILSLTTMLVFGMDLPDFHHFFAFGLFYALAKFAVAAVPGGAVIVATPLLATYLGFTPEMLGLVTAMYMIFDLFGTATNVTANGAFTIILSKLYPAVTGASNDPKKATASLEDTQVQKTPAE